MDIDIDIKKDVNICKLFSNAIEASRFETYLNDITSHGVGHYFQHIPKDPLTSLSAIPYEEANELGFFKIDFLHVNALNDFTSNDELKELANKEPDWSLLEHKYMVQKLFHIANHYDVVNRIKPHSILELSDVIAIIRPNKIKLLDKYLQNPIKMRSELYTRRSPEDMRKSHCIPYAQIIIAQMNLISMGRL